ncbi:hypothetical protein BY458DRAFT_454486 [Sporodiniella umbellata]|nr:hypothetical protein BY458DRAFT_454486 [Sporodiniella umbellata]
MTFESTQPVVSSSSHISNTSNDSQTGLTSQQGTTYFLLDVNEENDSASVSSSSSSSGSSISAQVVIDHVLSGKPRLRSEEESESDCAFSYSPARRDSDTDSKPPRSHLHRAIQPTDVNKDTASETGAASSSNQSHKKKHEKSMVTVYTEEDEDLVDEMPRGDHERMMRHNRRHRYRKRSVPRKRLHKRTQRVLQTELQSQTWSRRESTQSNRHPGLSSEEALSKLLYLAHQILKEERARIDQTAEDAKFILSRPEIFMCFVVGFSLLAFYVAGYFKSEPYQSRVTGLIVESLCLIAMGIWNVYLFCRERALTDREMTDRAATIIDALERNGMNMVQDTKIPFIPCMSVAKVVRDGVVRIFPVNLLVEGDIVEMLYGDVAPGRMKYIHKAPEEPSELDAKEYYLAKDQNLKPSFFGVPPPQGLMEEYMRSRGRHQFVLLETPIEKNMRSALHQKRPPTVMFHEAKHIIHIFYGYILWIVLVIALFVNFLRFGLKSVMVNHYPIDQLIEESFIMSCYAIIPLLPLCFPSMWVIARSFGNAQLLILFEALQISKTEYEDDDEVDEFDAEAPPPTKDLELSPNAVWDRFLSLLTKWDRLSLTRSTNLLESLGNTTVICCLDREGTIANPFPTVEQIMFPNNQEDIVYLDVEENSDEPTGLKFEDQDWDQYLPCLKPLGLNFMLNTNCGVVQNRKRSEYHRRRSKLHVYGKTSPARQSCLCRLGKCIGFREEALQSFALRSEIYSFAPYHELLNTAKSKYSKYYPFEVPNALSTVFEEKVSGSYQLLTDGHPALVMDKCSDYWDGTSLQTMSGRMEKKINDFFQNAMVHDMQCIAYAYRPINTVNGDRIPFLNPTDDKEQDPGCAFVVLPFKPLDSSDSNDSHSSDSSSSSGSNKKKHKRVLGKVKESDSSSSSLGSSESDTSDYSFEEDEPVDEQEEAAFYKEAVKGQIFLGMAALCHQPKQNVVDFIEDLGLAGIRFVYFSATAERESKAFAERLGLETDWNSCILLSNPDDEENFGNGYLQTHDIKAQLPRGIDEIRPHLEAVDDIPLHVSLFAECAPLAMKEMIRIFQENGEVVCTIGNALNTKNTEAFALSDISVGMEPVHTHVQNKGRLTTNDRQPPLAVGASLCSLPCGLFMQYETSLYAVTQLIRDARRLLNSVRMGFAFYAAGCMSMTLMLLLSFCLLLPPMMTGYQIIWLMWIVLPVLSISMLFTPHGDGIMLLMPGKNIEHLQDFWRFMVYFVLRFTLVVLMCIAIFCLTLCYSLKVGVDRIFGQFGEHGWYHWTEEEQWAVLYAQNFFLLSFVWYMGFVSLSFLHRTASVIEFVPFKNKVWVGAFFVSVIFQLCFCAVSLAHGPFGLSQFPWFVYLLIFAWPIVLVPVQELVKLHDNKEFTRFQKRSKLEFSTKLGMHSPL